MLRHPVSFLLINNRQHPLIPLSTKIGAGRSISFFMCFPSPFPSLFSFPTILSHSQHSFPILILVGNASPIPNGWVPFPSGTPNLEDNSD